MRQSQSSSYRDDPEHIKWHSILIEPGKDTPDQDMTARIFAAMRLHDIEKAYEAMSRPEIEGQADR